MESGLPLRGMQTSHLALLMSRRTWTLGAQTIGEDTALAYAGFVNFGLHGTAGYIITKNSP
ncbi:MAG: hypothetical protein FWB93_00150 [Oscillospiraceae bacterium]|nr:hypothetical protein [Oscillospiraceae bacterium]